MDRVKASGGGRHGSRRAMGTRSEGEPPRRSQRELQKQRTQTRLLEVRARLRVELGRDPTKSEIAKAAGVAPGLVTRYWDRVGVGEIPDAYLERLKTKVAERPADEPPLVALALVLLDFVEKLTPDELETLRREVRAQSASPEEEALRYHTLNVRWRPILAEALAHRGRSVPTEEEDKAVGRFVIIILDAAARWQERNFEGDVVVPTREAVAAAIPGFDN
jgi:AcrR family transcriptional regulator